MILPRLSVRSSPRASLSRWGRSTQDLVQTLDDLHGWEVSVLAQTGLSFDLSTASGKLMRTIMAGLAEFERDLIRERVKSGLASARGRGVKLGRRPSDKKAKWVLAMHKEGPVLPADRPQRRAQQEYGNGYCQARRGSRRLKHFTLAAIDMNTAGTGLSGRSAGRP